MSDRSGAIAASVRSRRQALAAILAGGLGLGLGFGAVCRDARAQIVDWSADDAARYAAFRKAFPEYDDMTDRDFSARMSALFQTLDTNPDADVVVAEVSRRLPEYRDAPRARIQRTFTSLFGKARRHFGAP